MSLERAEVFCCLMFSGKSFHSVAACRHIHERMCIYVRTYTHTNVHSYNNLFAVDAPGNETMVNATETVESPVTWEGRMQVVSSALCPCGFRCLLIFKFYMSITSRIAA